MATTEYVDLALLKLHLGGITASTYDDVLTKNLKAASRNVEKYCGRRFWVDDSASDRSFNPASRLYGEKLFIDDAASISSVSFGNDSDGWTVVDAADYELGPENALARSWAIESVEHLDGWTFTSARDRVKVSAVWGWPEVPDDVVEATLILASRYYARKDSKEGVLGNSEWGTVRLSRTDPDVAGLLRAFVLHGAV